MSRITGSCSAWGVVAVPIGEPSSYVAKYEGGDRRLDVLEFLDVATAIGFDPRKLYSVVAAEIVLNYQGQTHKAVSPTGLLPPTAWHARDLDTPAVKLAADSVRVLTTLANRHDPIHSLALVLLIFATLPR
jgi:hypothetical protein